VQTDLAAVRRYLRNLTEGVALLTFPACVGLALVAREFVPIVLGSKWHDAIAPLQILAAYAAFRSIVALLPKVLTAMGNARFVMWNDLATLIVMGSAFYVGSRWGVAGIAWAWFFAYPPVVIPLYRKTFATIEMQVGEYLECIRPALEGTLVMIVGVLTIGRILGPAPLFARLVVEVGTGVALYSGTLFLRHQKRMARFGQVVRIFRTA